VSDGASVNFNLAYPFFCHSIEHSQNVALVLDGENFTYSTLASMASRIAGWLNDGNKGHHGRRRVGILACRTLETYIGILGACWSGATYIPINVKAPTVILQNILKIADLDALILDERGAKRLTECGITMSFRTLAPCGSALSDGGCGADALESVVPLTAPVAMEPHDTAYVIFTSGTTGNPKGVKIGAGSVHHFLNHCRFLYGIKPEDRVSNFFEVTFDVSVFDLFATWGGGILVCCAGISANGTGALHSGFPTDILGISSIGNRISGSTQTTQIRLFSLSSSLLLRRRSPFIEFGSGLATCRA